MKSAKVQPGPYDDHASPLRAQDYVELRLQPMLRFYQRRIPRVSRIKTYLELCIIAGASLSSGVAFYGHHRAVAMITSVTTALAAYKAFHGTEGKITRYNHCCIQLRNLHTWWKTLSDVEQAS